MLPKIGGTKVTDHPNPIPLGKSPGPLTEPKMRSFGVTSAAISLALAMLLMATAGALFCQSYSKNSHFLCQKNKYIFRVSMGVSISQLVVGLLIATFEVGVLRHEEQRNFKPMRWIFVFSLIVILMTWIVININVYHYYDEYNSCETKSMHYAFVWNLILLVMSCFITLQPGYSISLKLEDMKDQINTVLV